MTTYDVRVIGRVRSPLTDLDDAPRQADEDAPEAVVELDEDVAAALDGLRPGDVVELLTWLHLARRDELATHPRGDTSRPLQGVFATRSPHRPNPIGLHTVRLVDVGPTWLRVAGLEALDGTPVIDVKIALAAPEGR